MAVKSAWGVDVSASSLKAVKLVLRKDGVVEVAETEFIPFAYSNEAEYVSGNLFEGFKTFFKKHRPGRAAVVCSLPTHSHFNRVIQVPPADPSLIHQTVQLEAHQHIPFPLDDVVWDYQIVDREYAVGEQVDVALYVVKRNIVDDFLYALGPAQFKVDLIQFAPLALFNFFRYTAPSPLPMAIIDIGGDNTDFIVLEGEKLWNRNIPIAGYDFTRVLAEKLQISFEEAEALKTGGEGVQPPAEASQAKKVQETVSGKIKDVVTEVSRSLGFYKSISKRARFEQLILLGQGGRLPGLAQTLEENIGLKVITDVAAGPVQIGPRVDPDFESALSSYLVATGLALQGLGVSENRVNFYPAELQKQKAAARKKPWMAVATVGFLAFAFLMHRAGSKGVADVVQLQNQVSALKAHVGELKQQYETVKEYQPLVDLLDQAVDFSGYPALSVELLQTMNYTWEHIPPPAYGSPTPIWVLEFHVHNEGPQEIKRDQLPGAKKPKGSPAGAIPSPPKKAIPKGKKGNRGSSSPSGGGDTVRLQEYTLEFCLATLSSSDPVTLKKRIETNFLKPFMENTPPFGHPSERGEALLEKKPHWFFLGYDPSKSFNQGSAFTLDGTMQNSDTLFCPKGNTEGNATDSYGQGPGPSSGGGMPSSSSKYAYGRFKATLVFLPPSDASQ